MNTISYSPGLHKLLTLQVNESEKLTDVMQFNNATQIILQKYGLEQVGIVAHCGLP